MRRVTRTDANQRAIVEALKTFGASVQHIRSGEDEGVPDLLVGYRGFNYSEINRRGKRIAELLTDGLTGPEVADALGITLCTVDWHKRQWSKARKTGTT